jgi:alkanesulfonate monooxygenase SsuD/methylene tetrahydromethanopterin reductase-like flavin-dependent oxidoreductase (luciferase family)
VPAPFRLGFLTHLHGSAEPRQLYRDYVELFVAAEELGFDSGWVAQHHFDATAGRLPSPFPFLAAIAERTRRIRLGTAVVTLPLEDPLRVAEDAAVLDALSGGRLELGVGSGTDPSVFAAFGKDVDGRRQANTAGVAALAAAFAGEPVGGTEFRLHPAAPGLAGRLWQAAFSRDGARFVAGAGSRLLLNRATFFSQGRTDEVQEPWAQAYRDGYSGPPGELRVGLSRGVYPAAGRPAPFTTDPPAAWSAPVGPEAVQVDHDALLAAARDDHDGLPVAGVLLAVRHEWRHEDVVTRLGLQPDLLVAVGEHERRVPGQHVDRGLRLAVVVVGGPGPGRDVSLAHPDLLGAAVLPGDRLEPGHPRGLAGVAPQFLAADLDERPVPVVLGHRVSP